MYWILDNNKKNSKVENGRGLINFGEWQILNFLNTRARKFHSLKYKIIGILQGMLELESFILWNIANFFVGWFFFFFPKYKSTIFPKRRKVIFWENRNVLRVDFKFLDFLIFFFLLLFWAWPKNLFFTYTVVNVILHYIFLHNS